VCDETVEPLTESSGEDFDGEMRDFLLDALVPEIPDLPEGPSYDTIQEDQSVFLDPLYAL